jgi:hypothetical protein
MKSVSVWSLVFGFLSARTEDFNGLGDDPRLLKTSYIEGASTRLLAYIVSASQLYRHNVASYT